jgi:hypothetical protein
MRKQIFSLIALLLATAVSAARAETSPSPRIVPIALPALRSAYLSRDADVQMAPVAAAEEQASLRQHFEVVIDLLLHSSDASLEAALDRLQDRRQEAWDDSTRAAWKRLLTVHRVVNLHRLRAYQARGVFPINLDDATHQVPVFVDFRGADCAVGHLMRVSGWGEQVDQIATLNNNIYVPDAGDSPVNDWVAYSGLTLEEAALIQPGYAPPTRDASFTQLLAGGTISKGGLTYSNFQMTRLNPTTSIENVSALAAPAPVIDGFFEFGGYYNDFLYVGAYGNGGPPQIGGLSSEDSSLFAEFRIKYTVTADQPGRRINAATFESTDFTTSNYVRNADMSTILYPTFKVSNAQGTELAFDDSIDVTAIGDFSPFAFQSDLQFPPQQSLQIEGYFGGLNADIDLTAFVFSFNLVPESGAFAIATMACATCLAGGRNKRSK